MTKTPPPKQPVAAPISRRAAMAMALSLPGSVPLLAQTPPAQPAPTPTRVKWLAADAATALERIAFGSCLHQSQPQPIWRPVIEAKPQLFLMLGDNVYGDVSDASLKELKAAYALQAAQPELAAAREKMPFLATWDDHDYGLNDASAAFPHKGAAREHFAAFWDIPPAELPGEGVYRARVIGPPGKRVQVILLDLRTFRSAFAEMSAAERIAALSIGKYKPDTTAGKTMLGDAQWAWLEQQLKVPAEIRIVASSIQLLAEAHGWERWGHLPVERERLLKLIATTGAKGVIVVSGDRHRAAIYKHTQGLPYPLYDITSSSLNISRAGGEPEDAGRISSVLAEDNFGLITIDWERRRLRAELKRLSGIKGDGIDLGFGDLGL
jgi:alkaline phosphatase D